MFHPGPAQEILKRCNPVTVGLSMTPLLLLAALCPIPGPAPINRHINPAFSLSISSPPLNRSAVHAMRSLTPTSSDSSRAGEARMVSSRMEMSCAGCSQVAESRSSFEEDQA